MRNYLFYLVILACVGCGPEMGTGRPAPGSDAGTLAPTPDANEPFVDPFEGLDRTPDPSCSGEWVIGVMGRVAAEEGGPLVGAYVQACIAVAGSDVRACLRPGVTGADGRYAVTFPPETRCTQDVVLRVVVPEAQLTTAYCRVHQSPRAAVLDAGGDVVLFRTERPESLPPVGDASATRTLRFSSGLSIDVAPADIGEDAYAQLSTRVLGGADLARACPGPAEESFFAALAFAPEASVRSRGGVPFRLPMGARAGLAHDLFVLGGIATELADGSAVPEAEWQRFGVARAGADGVVASEAGAGIVHLSTIGMRPTP